MIELNDMKIIYKIVNGTIFIPALLSEMRFNAPRAYKQRRYFPLEFKTYLLLEIANNSEI